MIGTSRILVEAPQRSDGAGRENLLEFLLLPYAAMGLAMLLVLLLLFLCKVLRAREEMGRRAEGIFEEARGHREKPRSETAISPAREQEAGNGP